MSLCREPRQPFARFEPAIRHDTRRPILSYTRKKATST
jgi:hypothetical protein